MVDGTATEVGPVTFADDLSSVTFTTGETLRFEQEAVRERNENRIVVASQYRQPFGSLSGELPGQITLAEGPRRHGAPPGALRPRPVVGASVVWLTRAMNRLAVAVVGLALVSVGAVPSAAAPKHSPAKPACRRAASTCLLIDETALVWQH